MSAEPTAAGRSSPVMLTIFKIQTALIMTAVLWIVVIEVGVRFIPVPGLRHDDLNPPELAPDRSMRNEGHPYLAYRLRPGWDSYPQSKKQFHHNQLGFRGRETTWAKPPGTFRVACVGGSSTYGHTPTADDRTWPARLEHHLREALPDRKIEVINAGTSGYSTFESLVNLSFRVLEFRPDLVIVYHSINDMRCALYPDPQVDNRHWRAVWPTTKRSAMEKYLEKSITYQILRRYATDYYQERADLAFQVIVDADRNFGEKKDPYVTKDPSHIGFTNTLRNLTSMVGICRIHGVTIILGTQGLWDADITSRFSRKAQLAGMQRIEDILRFVSREQDVPLVESARALEDEARQQARSGEQNIFSHEVHLTNEGADLLGKTFADYVLENGLIPPG